MRAVIQRVTSAAVDVGGARVGSIGPGVLVLVGCADGDTAKEVDWLSRKILSTRVWPDPATGKPWSVSVANDASKSVLLVSQFTLFGSVRKGTRPDFGGAMPGPAAQALFDGLVERVKATVEPESRVATGVFGAMMEVSEEGRLMRLRGRLRACGGGSFFLAHVVLHFFLAHVLLPSQVHLVNDGPVTLMLDSHTLGPRSDG